MKTWIGAFRGAFGFLTRLPVPHGEDDWDAFRSRPWTVPLVGYVIGYLVAIPLLAANTLSEPTVAFGFLLAVYALTGVHHLDGVADLGDALAAHGDVDRRREVLKDTTTGVGAILAISLVVGGLALGGFGLAGLPVLTAVGIVIVAEISTKLGIAAMACFANTEYEGMGKSLTDANGPLGFVAPLVVAVAAIALTWTTPVTAAVVLGALVGVAFAWILAIRHLGGISGDVFGAANEIGRLVAVHAGVIGWMLL